MQYNVLINSEDAKMGPPMAMTESGPIFKSGRFVKSADFE